MATFAYEAMNDAGKPTKGTVEAANKEEAIARIKSQRLFPTNVAEQKASKKEAKAAGKAKAKPKKKETLREKVKRLEAQVKRLKAKKKVEIHNHYTTADRPLTAEDLLAWGKVGGPSGLF